MKKILLFEKNSLYRDSMKVYGYLFGAEDLDSCEKTLAIIGGMRGNEFTQMYEASEIVRRLGILEKAGKVTQGKGILVIPAANPYSINSEKRFWPTDNTDINRMFPGYVKGETTQRVAAALFEILDDFEYGIHLTSHYISGSFIPHVSIQITNNEYYESASDFGLAYVRLRKPSHYDTTTLNYNWQIWNTKAYSIYGGTDKTIDREASELVVNAVLNFMDHRGLVQFNHHRGYISRLVTEEDLIVVKSDVAGFLDCKVRTGEFVRKGQNIARILDVGDGHVKTEIKAEEDSTVFFVQSNPLAFAGGQLMILLK